MHLISIYFVIALFLLSSAHAQVVVNEIQYKPVELDAFNPDGTPVLDLTEDVHEFIELRNAGASAVDMSGWKLTDGVSYTFPAGTNVAAGGFVMIAKNVARIQTVYGITGVLGPWMGKLSNSGDTVRLKDSGGVIVDAVSYSSGFPWAQSAAGLGANPDFLGISLTPYQYKGRSLQRVSPTATSNDAANWLASPFPGNPTPGTANTVTRAIPKPVVVALSIFQNDDESPVIRTAHAVRVECDFLQHRDAERRRTAMVGG